MHNRTHFTQLSALKLEKTKILCYNISNSIRIGILKRQKQDKEAEQKTTNCKNQKLSTGGNRQEIKFSLKAQRKNFSLALFFYNVEFFRNFMFLRNETIFLLSI